jgi:D-amino peptidase
MKVLISADMEGVSGVVIRDHVSAAHKEYERFRQLMTAEVNAAIEGALAGGAETILVNDSHGSHTNLLIEDLNPAAALISGSPKPFGMMQGIGPDVDAVFLVGYHAAAGATAGVLAHTWMGILFEVRLNDQTVGETGLNAALAGAYGVPVCLVTGDTAVVREAQALLGEIETMAVKEGLTGSAAQCIHPEVARQRIREAAARALQRSAAPFVLPSPITLRLVFHHAIQADLAALVPVSQRINGRTVEWTGQDMPSVYKAMQAMAYLASRAG